MHNHEEYGFNRRTMKSQFTKQSFVPSKFSYIAASFVLCIGLNLACIGKVHAQTNVLPGGEEVITLPRVCPDPYNNKGCAEYKCWQLKNSINYDGLYAKDENWPYSTTVLGFGSATDGKTVLCAWRWLYHDPSCGQQYLHYLYPFELTTKGCAGTAPSTSTGWRW